MNEATYELATELAIEQSFERDDEAYDEMVREDAEFGTFGDQLAEARAAHAYTSDEDGPACTCGERFDAGGLDGDYAAHATRAEYGHDVHCRAAGCTKVGPV